MADETPADEAPRPEVGFLSPSARDMISTLTSTVYPESPPMGDETPTLRCPRCGNPVATLVREAGRPTWYGPCGHKDLLRDLPHDAAARLLPSDPAAYWPESYTRDDVATLFDQRDAAITERDRLRALVGDEEVDREHWGTVPRDEAVRQANEKHNLFMEWHDQHDRRRDERDDARAEVERMRPVLEAALAVVADRRLVVATGLAVTRQGQALVAAVDVYNQPPSPDGETEVK